MQARKNSTASARIFRAFWRLLLLLLALPLSYLLAAHFALFFTDATPHAPSTDAPITIYVIDNGIHIDIVVPRKNAQMDWDSVFVFENDQPTPELDYLAIGWGDQAFYLETPSWADLRLSTAIRALSGQNPSLLHVSYLSSLDLQAEQPIALYPSQYQALIEHIQSSAADTINTAIPDAGYDHHDFFFAANGSYSAITTCNTWAADGLAKAGLVVPRWAPFPWLVGFYRDVWPKR